MNTTLFSFVRALPALAGRVYLDAAPSGAVYPLAVVWDTAGGVTDPYSGTSSVMAVYPCVTVYDQPATGENTAAVRLRVLSTLDALRGAKDAINLHSDGLTPFIPGSVQVVTESVPILDQNAAGRYYATLKFSALLFRS